MHVTLLKDRTNAVEAVIVVVLPVVFGILTGIMLGVSEIGYLVMSVLGILGGLVAGMEHEYGLEGFYRGLLGGLLFGTSILLAHGIADNEAKAELPDPEILVVLITAVFGAVLGAIGGRMREKRLRDGRR